MEPSGRPFGCSFVMTEPSMVPQQRSTFAMSTEKCMRPMVARHSLVYGISRVASSVRSRPTSGAMLGTKCGTSAPGKDLPRSFSTFWSIGLRSSRDAFQLSSTPVWRRHSTWPTISSTVRKPRLAMTSRSSSAVYSMKFITCSGLPAKRFLRHAFCVAMPTGQVSCWQSRCIRQPSETSAGVPKPNSSAPSRHAIATSRPSMSFESASTTTRERRPFRSSVCCVSARPSSRGSPAW